jgi:uncharacterized protein (DUF1684 family)
MITVALVMLTVLPQADFLKELEIFRKDRDASLSSPRGWLSVAGLFWLREGSQTMGSDTRSDIVLPASAPVRVGTITLAGAKASVQVEQGVSVTVNKGPVPATLKSDVEGGPDIVQIGDLSLALIQRGKRIGFRLWDPNATNRLNFKGCQWFAPDPLMVIKARFVAHKAGQTVPITNVLGDTEPQPNPGYVEFRLQGQACRLEAVGEGDSLFFNFKDGTSGKESYAAGRFLYSDGPKDGFVVLDFNRAVNPPCAYTDFATCPLPPKGNVLKVRVAAGEKAFHH